MAPSETSGSVIDLAFPVFDQDGDAKASFVVPLLPVIGRSPATEAVKGRVVQAAHRISAVIGRLAAEAP
jgi:DNA-binding IclR family transcriptional regulator